MNKYTFMGNGRNKDFYFTFPFFTKADIIVKINNTVATGYGIFCIQGPANNDFPFTGGHIHFANAPKTTDTVTIERKLQYNRLIDYQPTEAFNPTTVNQDMNYFFELLKDIKSDLTGFAQTYAEFTATETAQTLLNRIDAVNDEIDTVTTKIENLGDITTIRTNITNLGTSVSNLTESLDALSSTVGTHTTNLSALDTFKNEVLDYVIEKQDPTSSNNYTWYRKYKSGWVEQGGHYTHDNVEKNVTITLPVTMNDANYSLSITKELGSAADAQAYYRFMSTYTKNSKTTTSFQMWMTAGNRLNGADWQVSGMAAQQ